VRVVNDAERGDPVAAGPAGRAGARPVRVCMLAETFHPVIGGCESQSRLLADQLVRRGHEVLVVTRRTSRDLPEEDSLDGARIRRVGPAGPGGGKRWPMVVTAAAELRRRRHEFDLLLVLGFRALGLVTGAVRSRGIPVVLKAESNGEMSGDFFSGRLEALGLRSGSVAVRALLRGRDSVLRRADAFVAISAAVESELLDAGIAAERVARIPNAVDTSRFRPADADTRRRLRARLGILEDEVVVTFTGRLVRYKGLPLLLRVWERLAPGHPRARLMLVGSGGSDIHACEDELRAFVAARSLQGSVTFTGAVANVQEHLQASDAFVFPTLNEAFGLSLVEAMACGLPVIASRTGGVPDIVADGDDGVLVAPGDEPALEAALRDLLTGALDVSALGAAARDSAVSRYSVGSVLDSYESLFHRCIDR
jgi:glycosyltransferase involved in cell wall biosynthesis